MYRSPVCHRIATFYYLHLYPLFAASQMQTRTYTISKKEYNFPEILETDLREQFMRGSGPGGQGVGTSSNCVQLKHIPTGVVVKVHDTRSLQQNRKIARERMREHVDRHINGDRSYLSQIVKEKQQNRADKRAKTTKKLEMKKQLRELLNNNEA